MLVEGKLMSIARVRIVFRNPYSKLVVIYIQSGDVQESKPGPSGRRGQGDSGKKRKIC